MSNINHYDWRIHRKLDEARRVYICPARGNGKLERTREMYEDLLDQGKEITFVRAADLPKKDPLKIHKELLDMDLCYHREPSWFEKMIDDYLKKELYKHLQVDTEMERWKPRIITDTTVVDDAFLYNWNLYGMRILNV